MKNKIKVGIQGIKASYHDVAAGMLLGDDRETVECSSFKLLCSVLEKKRADLCLMAIENSIAGSILTNYSLLEEHRFKIIGEVYLRIEHCLMALPGRKIKDLKIIKSHPMALLQCEDFLTKQLNAFPLLKIMETTDTADSAKDVKDNGLLTHGVIASEYAAKTYGLKILRKGIETNHRNYTRFLVICREADRQLYYEMINNGKNADKATMRFEAKDYPGSLVRVLSVFSKYSINMTKIQSVPILGRPYEYSFHVDLEWEDIKKYQKAIKAVKGLSKNLIHFGEYRRVKL